MVNKGGVDNPNSAEYEQIADELTVKSGNLNDGIG